MNDTLTREEMKALIPDPIPITKADVDNAIRFRNRVAGAIEDAEVKARLLKAQIRIWTPHTLMAMGAFIEEVLRESRFYDEEHEAVMFSPPYHSTFDYSILSHGNGAKALATLFDSEIQLIETLNHDAGAVPGFWSLSASSSGEVTNTRVPRVYSSEGLASLDDERRGLWNGAMVMMAYVEGRYALAESRSPSAPIFGKASKPSNRPDVVAVVARRPEKVQAREDQRRRERLEAEGKKWEVSCEFPVTGFWRNQWYPSIKAHKKVWVDGFIKGIGKPQRKSERVIKVQRHAEVQP